MGMDLSSVTGVSTCCAAVAEEADAATASGEGKLLLQQRSLSR